MKNDGKFRGGPKYGNRGGPKYGNRGYTHRREHQHQHLSPQQIHPADGGAQFPTTPGSSQSALQVQQCNQRQDQFQVTNTTTADFVAPQSWPIQNSLSQSQLPASTTPNVLQYANAMQGNEQYGYMQNGQDYNQMWQNYYYQQQQQQLQLQQHYIQLQQQPFQPESSQQHSQPEPLQPQQLQPLQLQQQDLQQQQQQYFQQQQEHPVYLQQAQPSTQVSISFVAVRLWVIFH
jgi:pre-mRNA-processing factor 39